MVIKLKKSKKENSKGSIFSLLINNYILFTVIIIISAILISSVSNYFIFGNYDATLGLTEKYQNYLKEEKFNKLNLKEITGEEGSIEILDEKCKLKLFFYCSSGFFSKINILLSLILLIY